MTKQQHLKQQARELRRANPGMRLADAMRVIAERDSAGRATWRFGDIPWIRVSGDPCVCFYCGLETASLSFGDMEDDNGRVQIYCASEHCDAREIEIVVVEDGTEATRGRSDVRILRYYAPTESRVHWPGSSSGWPKGTAPSIRNREVIARCAFCGELTCVLSRNDVAIDQGRIRLHCRNALCAVEEAEGLLMRGGELATNRLEVKALRALFVSRADQLEAALSPGEPPIFSLDDSFTPGHGVDPLGMRISGPVPWE